MLSSVLGYFLPRMDGRVCACGVCVCMCVCVYVRMYIVCLYVYLAGFSKRLSTVKTLVFRLAPCPNFPVSSS